MKVIMITDDKPTSCEQCGFHGQILKEDKERPDNTLNIVDGCLLTNKADVPCPLLEDARYFTTLDKNKDFTMFVDDTFDEIVDELEEKNDNSEDNVNNA